MREALLQAGLEGVVSGRGDGVLGEDVSKDRDPVDRATDAGQRGAVGRRVGPEADQRNSTGAYSRTAGNEQSARPGVVWQMQPLRSDHGPCGNGEGIVLKEWSACARAQGRIQIKASLRKSRIDVVRGKQPVPLRSDIA